MLTLLPSLYPAFLFRVCGEIPAWGADNALIGDFVCRIKRENGVYYGITNFGVDESGGAGLLHA